VLLITAANWLQTPEQKTSLRRLPVAHRETMFAFMSHI